MVSLPRKAWLGAVLVLLGCSDPATFRPARGAKDSPSVKNAYRVHGDPGCDDIGGVVEATSIDDVAETAANHGGTHYQIMNDFGDASLETETHGGYGYGAFHAQSTSRVVKHHVFVARVYRCGENVR